MYVGRFKVGKEVAVLPSSYAAARDVLEIAVVEYVSAVYLQLADGRIFEPATGRQLGSADSYYIAPANDEHRAALASRAAAAADNGTDTAKPPSLGGAQGD
jgi:hypothetical protein